MRSLQDLHCSELRSLFDVYSDYAGDAGFVHGDTEQLVRHFHRNLIMSDENELHGLRHLFNEIGIAPYVRIIEWRINLVEHTERRRV